MTIYSAGLRLNEAVHLKVSDIDSQRMMIRVEQGKGAKDRYTLLAKRTLDILREYWRAYRPRDWLFYSRSFERPLSSRTVQVVLERALYQAGIQKPATVHTLRHYAEFRIMPSTGLSGLSILGLAISHSA
jgi:site-specific recombinase XerD